MRHVTVGFLINLFPSYLLQNTQLITSQTGISTEKTQRRDRKIIHIIVSSSHCLLGRTRTFLTSYRYLARCLQCSLFLLYSSSSGTEALPSASSSNALPKIASNHKTVFVKASDGTIKILHPKKRRNREVGYGLKFTTNL